MDKRLAPDDAGAAEPPLNGQQMAALQRKFQTDLKTMINDTDLRKLSLDKATTMASVPNVKIEVMTLAREMYAFLSEPLKPD